MSNSSGSGLIIDTPPSVTQCQNTTITWYGGVEPFYVGYIASGTVGTTSTPSPAVAFRTGEQSQEWLCNVAAGVEITLNVRDSAGTIAYSSPVEVQNSTDLTCLPGYVPPPSSSSSGLSKGAIGGIAAGAVVAAIIVAAVLIILWRRRRRSSRDRGPEWTEKGSDGTEDEGGEPKVEPYVRQGEVDLADEVHYPTSSSGPTATASHSTGAVAVPALEREVKQMLGVQPASTSESVPPSSVTRADASPIPTKSHSGPSRSSVDGSSPVHSPLTVDGTDRTTSPPVTHSASAATNDGTNLESASGDVEYVRHTDGGGMRVELPPLYSDIPRDQDGRI